LRAAGDAARRRFFESRIGQESRVLVEKSADGNASGHCEHFAPVRLQQAAAIGTVVTARITGATDSELVGRLAA
jgi:tRNA A37 methylthiotransferase MiaB